MAERLQSTGEQFIKRLSVSTEGITPEEKELSDKLVEAAIAIAPIYALQQNENYPGANFYPHDVTPGEIEEASKQDTVILSEYTVVKRATNNELTAVPYHQEYRELLVPVSEKLIQAAEMCQEENLKNYLNLRAQSLLDGDYEKSEKVWLSNREPTVDIVIGPYDRYLDKLFSRKFAYLAWTGIIDREETNRAQKFVGAFLEAYGWQGSPIRARADRTRIFSGLASIGWSANNLPCQPEWRDKYGSKITIFLPSFHERFAQRLQALHSIWPQSKDLDSGYLEGISRIFLFAHESCHPLIRRSGDEQRLKGQYSTISELYCDILGILVSKELISREISQQDWELLTPTFLAWGVARYKEIQTPSALSAYLTGEAIGLNFLLDKSAMAIENGTVKITSIDILDRALKQLTQELEFIVSEGNENDAQNLVAKFGNHNRFALVT